MRVLHVVHGSPRLGAVGGTELYVDALARATGADVAVPGTAGRLDGDYTVWSGPLGATAQAARPDVLHVHHLAGHGVRVPRLPTVITLHDYHLVCLRGQLVDHAASVCEGPGLLRCRACVGWSPPKLALRALAVRELARRARLLSPSRDLATRMTGFGLGEIHVLDLPLVDPVETAPEPVPGPVRFLFVGSLIPTKGPHVLARAMEGLEATATIFGPGEGDYVDQLLAGLPSNTRHGGVFGPADRSAVFAEHDVLVVPSTWHENSPLVVREAIAAGLRVVCSDVGGIAEIDPTACRVPPDDVTALRAALTSEVATGRGRRGPRAFPMPEHLAALAVHYAACS
ncbi:MAG: glycosyltransferase family 4 protein [Proteobacteria bacterium]|nr:glycosyltransferase family 4 protein [Pseudomonadota bacterium]MCP4917691.1 glycosyltransferase family 4 protein [Pseudomonadota bacterium]